MTRRKSLSDRVTAANAANKHTADRKPTRAGVGHAQFLRIGWGDMPDHRCRSACRGTDCGEHRYQLLP